MANAHPTTETSARIAAGASAGTAPPVGVNAAPAPLRYDVWSWPGRKYRVRAAVLLGVNVVLFVGLGSFAFWLRSGVAFAPALDNYWTIWAQSFQFLGDNPVTLQSMLVAPINVRDVPMQIPIVGLLMAAMISIPILVAILYRFWASLPFLAVLAFVAMMPWLAITMLVSCAMVSARPLRFSFRFMSALLALVPAVIYLTLASRGRVDIGGAAFDPADQIKLVAPWVLAIVAAAAGFALVLTLARAVNYRPGAVTPLLVMLFALPMALFEVHVGRDELYYRLLAARDRQDFADVDADQPLQAWAAREYFRRQQPDVTFQQVRDHAEQLWAFALTTDIAPYASELARVQTDFALRCEAFLRQFPTNRYVANVLFLKARALDRRVDPIAFRTTKWIRFYDDFPARASRETWRTLAELQPASPLTAIAWLRLAQLDAREGDVDRALEKLERLRREFAAAGWGELNDTVADGSRGPFDRRSPEAALPVPLARATLEAGRLYDLLKQNRDPIYAYDPIGVPRRATGPLKFGLLHLHPRHERYLENLQALKQAYPNCQIEDNIDLEIAKVTPDARGRAAMLTKLLERFPERDAVPEALYQLGCAYRELGDGSKAQEQFARLKRDYPRSIWAQQASLQRQPPASGLLTDARP